MVEDRVEDRVEDFTLNSFSWLVFIRLTPFFSGTVGNAKLHYCVEGICLINNGCYENGKETLIQLS